MAGVFQKIFLMFFLVFQSPFCRFLFEFAKCSCLGFHRKFNFLIAEITIYLLSQFAQIVLVSLRHNPFCEFNSVCLCQEVVCFVQVEKVINWFSLKFDFPWF